ncbi:MAG: hypothetical protein J6R35_00435 [Clostridia bacterium]|nr:hypothetical protein [Clostridia bacterium]
MNKRNKIVLFMIVVFLMVCAMVGCGNKKGDDKAVSSISIVAGSFKDSYELDEVPDFTNAKMIVNFKGGGSQTIAITPNMVTGLDTSTTTQARTLTVTYKGVTATFIYKVSGMITIDTSFRLGIAVSDADSELLITVKGSRASTLQNGVYAVAFTVSTTGGINLKDASLKISSGYLISVFKISDTALKVVLTSSTGYDALPDSCELVEIKATKPSSKGTINIQNATISDGELDYIVPSLSYTYGG